MATMSYAERRWEAIRATGRRRFVLLWGVGYWGSTTAVLLSAFDALVRDKDPFEHLPARLLTFWIAGVFWGSWVWRYNEGRRRLSTGE
jgi:hypothetical protein